MTRVRWGWQFLWALPALFLSLFFLYPLGTVFVRAGGEALTDGINTLAWRNITRPLIFSFQQATLSTLLTLLIGLPAAYVLSRFHFPGRRLVRLLVNLPFILPTVVVAAAFSALVGPRGWLNLGLMAVFNLSSPPIQLMNSLTIILMAHVFYNTTIVVRMVGAAWEGLDPRLEDAAQSLGASHWEVQRRITLPLLRPSILAAALLVFIFDFTSFGVVLLLGGPRFTTLEVEIYIQAMRLLNLPMAGLLSLIQLLCTAAFAVLYTWLNRRRMAIPLAQRVKGEGQIRPRSLGQKAIVGGMVLVLAVLMISPLAALVVRSVARLEAARGDRGQVQQGLTLDYYQELFVNRRNSIFYIPPARAIATSLQYGFQAGLICLLVGIPAAYALNSRTGGSKVLDVLLYLPLGSSAVTLGLGFLLAFRRPPFNAGEFTLLVPIAHSLVALPFMVRALQPAIASIPPNLRQGAAVLGARPWQVWSRVDLPLLRRAMLAGLVFAFTISLGEFGATSLLARPDMPTIPLAIAQYLSQPGGLNYGQAMAMSTILLATCAAGIWAVEEAL